MEKYININWFKVLAEDENVRFLINMECREELAQYLFNAYPLQHYRPDYMVSEDLSIFWVILTQGHQRCWELYGDHSLYAFMSRELHKFYADEVDINPLAICNPNISEFELDRIRKYFMKRIKNN